MGFCTIDGVDVNCEVTQKLGPIVPMDLRELTHSGAKLHAVLPDCKKFNLRI